MTLFIICDRIKTSYFYLVCTVKSMWSPQRLLAPLTEQSAAAVATLRFIFLVKRRHDPEPSSLS